jgi:hypothetical protein
MKQSSRLDLESSNLDWFTEIHDVCIGMRNRKTTGEHLQASSKYTGQVAYGPIRQQCRALKRRANGSMDFAHQRAYSGHVIHILENDETRRGYRL